MVRILVTNDDGYRSDGIHALARALHGVGDVTIVAPVSEASAIGHALTLRHPLRLERIDDHVFAVDGTPTDCVNLGITHVFKGLADLVVSGINKGWNLGDDITYSGTVAGALEGALLAMPSIAVSLRQTRGDYDFGYAARAAASIAERHDPKGRSYYWIEEGQNDWEPHDRSDYQAVRDGYVSVTPLHPDLTAYHALAAVEALSLEREPVR